MGIHKNTYRSFSNVIGLILLSHFVFSQHDSSLKKYEAGIHFDCIRNFVKVSFPPSGVKNRSGWALGAFYQRKIALNYWGRIETNYTLSGFFDEKYGALNDLFFLQLSTECVLYLEEFKNENEMFGFASSTLKFNLVGNILNWKFCNNSRLFEPITNPFNQYRKEYSRQ